LGTYEVDLYGEWERKGYGARNFIDYMMGRGSFRFSDEDFELVDARVTRQDADPYYGDVLREYGTVHVRLDVSADNGAMALKKAKGKIRRWLRDHTCSPPTIKWL
jgi:hypothetical protein